MAQASQIFISFSCTAVESSNLHLKLKPFVVVIVSRHLALRLYETVIEDLPEIILSFQKLVLRG